MTASCRSSTTLFLIILPTTAKSLEIFRLPRLCYITIRVEAFRAQNGLISAITASRSATACPSASNLPSPCAAGVVTAQGVPRERENIFHLNMLQLSVRGKRKPPSIQLLRLQKKKSQRTNRTTTERVFSSNLTTPGLSFAPAPQGKREEQQQPQTYQMAVAGPATTEPRVPAPLPQN
jgi:hypothetical protein